MQFQDSIARIASSRRILVLGPSGSGKTTFAIRLARILQLKSIHLDAHFWKPGWIPTPQTEWRSIVSGLIEQPSWIMDGTYESTLDLRIPAADCIITVDGSRWICLWRVLKRKLTVDDRRRPDAPAGQKLDRAFFKYIWQYPTITQPLVLDCIRQYGSDKTLIRLRGDRAIKQCLDQVRSTVQIETGSH